MMFKITITSPFELQGIKQTFLHRNNVSENCECEATLYPRHNMAGAILGYIDSHTVKSLMCIACTFIHNQKKPATCVILLFGGMSKINPALLLLLVSKIQSFLVLRKWAELSQCINK